MAPRKKEKVTVNVMLLKDNHDITNPREFIQGYRKTRIIPLGAENGNAFVYYKKNPGKKPDWLKKLSKIVNTDSIESKIPSNNTCGVNLLVAVDGKVFSINYGTLARHNIKKEAVDETFGIYTAAKVFYEDDSDQTLKSLQSRVVEGNPVNKQRQYGDSIQPEEVFLSMEDNEALREITILSSGDSDYTRLIGKYNSLNVQFEFSTDDVPYIEVLPSKLKSLLKIYQSVSDDDIKRLFKGLFPIHNNEKTNDLFRELTSQIAKGFDGFFLFEPELDFDFSSVSEYIYVVNGEEHTSDGLSLSNYLDVNKSSNKDDWEKDHIKVVDEDGNLLKKWHVIDCLYGEMLYDSNHYILSHGDWFSIEKDKYDRVVKKVESITSTESLVTETVASNTRDNIDKFKHDNPGKKADKERIFNKQLCQEYDGELFDEVSRQIKVYEDKFEVCDIYLPEKKEFVHVKYYYNASALSHLFNQGFVSAACHAKYTSDFTDKANAHIERTERHIPMSPKGCVVHYLILNTRSENRLTFFSKMVLEDKISQLEAMNYQVKLSWANDVY